MSENHEDPLIDTWEIHNRIHLYLLGAMPDEALPSSLIGRGRTVYDLFAHIHNVRLMWLKVSAPDLMAGLDEVEPKSVGTTGSLAVALTASSTAIAELLRRSLPSGGHIKGFKPHATAFVGYLTSHESHHRGQIEWALKVAGKPLSDSVSYGLWEWGTR